LLIGEYDSGDDDDIAAFTFVATVFVVYYEYEDNNENDGI